jgi:vancomycin resistance protein YoaR
VRSPLVRLVAAGVAVAGVAVAVGLAFAGSPDELAEGTRVAGVDVGGLTTKQAVALLERRSEQLADMPVTFVVGPERWRIRPRTLGVEPNWAAAVAQAKQKGEGFAVVRGYRRLALRFSPENVEPGVRSYEAAVAYELDRLADSFDRPQRPARIVRRGLDFELVAGTTGRRVDRDAAAAAVVAALAGFERRPVELPVSLQQPRVTKRQLAQARLLAERAVSAPVRLTYGGVYLTLPPRRLAGMLELPTEPGERLALGGPVATAYFARLDRQLGTPPRDATFAVDGGEVTVVPSKPGVAVDVPLTAKRVLTAATKPGTRVAPVAVARAPPERTTAEAKAMGITGVVSSYETIYGGIANRIHNVQLVARLVDGALIAPGATFSFNETTGERTAEKGFLEAPVIINGELQTGLGGGVCQVSTTVFNAAYEAGLPIATRTNHALYISHYPLGRDATVDYPGIDMQFVNDTGRWLLLRTFVGSSSLVVNLYGTPQNRRVVTETEPLQVVSPAPVIRKRVSSLAPGTWQIESAGVPAQSTSVHRTVYSADGAVLSEGTWYSTYVAEPRVILLGPKPVPKPAVEKEPAKGKKAVGEEPAAGDEAAGADAASGAEAGAGDAAAGEDPVTRTTATNPE